MNIPTIMIDPSKIRTALVYHLGEAKLNLGSSTFSKSCSIRCRTGLEEPNGSQSALRGRVSGPRRKIVGRPLRWPVKYNAKLARPSTKIWYRNGGVTYHGTVAEQRTRSAERVGDQIEWLDGACFEVPDCTPGRVIIDLQWVIRSPVEP